MEYLERKYNEGKTDVPMRIAYGYAIFDEQYDKIWKRQGTVRM